MNFEEEPWVKLYVRDTASWLSLTFMARSVFLHLLRKCSRHGVVDLGRSGVRALPGLLGGPEHRAEIDKALRELVQDGAIELSEDETRLVLPRFEEAQQARMSTRARAKVFRDKKKAPPPPKTTAEATSPAFANVTPRDGAVTPRDETERARNVTKRDDNVTPRDAGITERDERGDAPRLRQSNEAFANVTPRDGAVTPRDETVPNRIDKNRLEGGGRARAGARKTPSPSRDDPGDQAGQPLVRALADGAGELWSNDGEPWRRSALEGALAKHDFDEDEARSFGRFLKRTGVAESLKTQRVSPYWLVFGASPQRAEFRHFDAALAAYDEWTEREEQLRLADAAQRRAQRERGETKHSPPLRSSEDVRAAMGKVLEGFKRTPQPLAVAATDDELLEEGTQEPNATEPEQRGTEALGGVLDEIMGAAR